MGRDNVEAMAIADQLDNDVLAAGSPTPNLRSTAAAHIRVMAAETERLKKERNKAIFLLFRQARSEDRKPSEAAIHVAWEVSSDNHYATDRELRWLAAILEAIREDTPEAESQGPSGGELIDPDRFDRNDL